MSWHYNFTKMTLRQKASFFRIRDSLNYYPIELYYQDYQYFENISNYSWKPKEYLILLSNHSAEVKVMVGPFCTTMCLLVF